MVSRPTSGWETYYLSKTSASVKSSWDPSLLDCFPQQEGEVRPLPIEELALRAICIVGGIDCRNWISRSGYSCVEKKQPHSATLHSHKDDFYPTEMVHTSSPCWLHKRRLHTWGYPPL